MQLGIIGLGRMGGNIARRLLADGHTCVVYDLDCSAIDGVAAQGAAAANSLVDLVRQLAQPRHVWVMLPAGEPTEDAISALAATMAPGDTIIDGGNTYYRDDVRRAKALKARGYTTWILAPRGESWD